MSAEKQNRILSICASVGLHGLMAVILVFSLSGNTMIPRNPAQIDFVWVSLAARDKTSFFPVLKDRRIQKPAAEALTGLSPDMPAVRNVRVETDKIAEQAAAAARGQTSASFGTGTVAYAAAGGSASVSDAGRPAAPDKMAPALSNAYPLYRENPPPGYPELARQQGYEGVVLVAAEILADGRVGKAVVSKSSGYAILDRSAVNAVKQWKFEPAKKSGIPYKTWAELPIKFVISDYHSQS
ncbi:MAG: energy transducer TonB [Deltaproteobacteria bacterium]